MFKIDDGIAPRDLKIDVVRQGLREVRKKFLECATQKKKEVCYALASNDLIAMFGSLMPRVLHDVELRFFLLYGLEGVLLYDADRDVYKITTLDKLVSLALEAL
ncbi:MAG: hypothetical protein ACP5H5_03475 [Pyrobaculum sp.]